MAIISPLPYTFVNGTTIDATQVNADLAQILANVNANAAENGANSSITSLSGLTTPLTVAQGGTGTTGFSGAGLVFGDGLSPLASFPETGLIFAHGLGAPTTVEYIAPAVAAWAPVDASGASLVFASVNASFVQIGNLIFAYAGFFYPATASGLNAKIGAFPGSTPNLNYASTPFTIYRPSAQTEPLVAAIEQNDPSGVETTVIVNPSTQAVVTNAALSGQEVIFMAIYTDT